MGGMGRALCCHIEIHNFRRSVYVSCSSGALGHHGLPFQAHSVGTIPDHMLPQRWVVCAACCNCVCRSSVASVVAPTSDILH